MKLLWYSVIYNVIILHKSPHWAIDNHTNTLKYGGTLNEWIIVDDII